MNITERADGHVQIEIHGLLFLLSWGEMQQIAAWTQAQSLLHPQEKRMIPEQRAHISYTEAIKRHLCPYCGLQGHLDPEAPDDPDFQGYVDVRGHKFYVEREED